MKKAIPFFLGTFALVVGTAAFACPAGRWVKPMTEPAIYALFVEDDHRLARLVRDPLEQHAVVVNAGRGRRGGTARSAKPRMRMGHHPHRACATVWQSRGSSASPRR